MAPIAPGVQGDAKILNGEYPEADAGKGRLKGKVVPSEEDKVEE